MKDRQVAVYQARFRVALQLFDFAINAVRARLQRERPELANDEREKLVTDWIMERPGAETGDCAGPMRERKL